MKIVRLDIDGFRGVRNGTIQLDDFSVLIGSNNCGKTTVIEVIALLLGRDRLIRTLTEHDFFGSDPQPADRIHIVGTVSGFEPNDPSDHHDWFRMGRGVEKWFAPVSGEVSAVRRDDTDLLVCQIAFCARFDRATLEVDTIRYFFDDYGQEDPWEDEAVIRPVPGNLIRDIGLFLVPANRTWDRMISFGSELFRRTVAYVGGRPAEAVLDERDRLRNPESPLDEDEKLTDLIHEINSDLRKFLGRDTTLKLRLTSTDSDGVLEAVIPHFTELGSPLLPSRRHGNGLISLQTLVLLMRFGHLRKANGENFLMAIEEPELHIPPPPQRSLLHFMRQLATQTIITTHSPIVAAVPNPNQLILLVNNGGELSARPLLSEPLDPEATNVRRALFLTDRDATVTAVMHPSILVPEGKTDASWLRLLSRIASLTESDQDLGVPSFNHNVGVIPTKDARVMDTYLELAGVHPMISCLVDGDDAGRGYLDQLTAANPPCPRVVVWPEDWSIEHVIAWLISADPTVLDDDELTEIGIPQDIGGLPAFLLANPHKTDVVIHALIADAIAANQSCVARVWHLLSVIASIATQSDVPADAAFSRLHENQVTTVWTFNDAFPGI